MPMNLETSESHYVPHSKVAPQLESLTPVTDQAIFAGLMRYSAVCPQIEAGSASLIIATPLIQSVMRDKAVQSPMIWLSTPKS